MRSARTCRTSSGGQGTGAQWERNQRQPPGSTAAPHTHRSPLAKRPVLATRKGPADDQFPVADAQRARRDVAGHAVVEHSLRARRRRVGARNPRPQVQRVERRVRAERVRRIKASEAQDRRVPAHRTGEAQRRGVCKGRLGSRLSMPAPVDDVRLACSRLAVLGGREDAAADGSRRARTTLPVRALHAAIHLATGSLSNASPLHRRTLTPRSGALLPAT